MHLVRFRVLLPVVMLALSAALISVGRAHEAADEAISAAREPVTEIDPKTGEFYEPLSRWDYHEPLSTLAMCINFPALVVAGAPLLLLKHNSVLWVVRWPLLVIVVLSVWYWVGRGIDRRRRILPSAKKQYPRWLRILVYCSGLMGCACFIFELFHSVIGAILLVPAYIWTLGLAAFWSKGLYRAFFR